MEPEELRWQVRWLYLEAWWGPKAEMLKKYWFYLYFLKGQGRPEFFNRANNTVTKGVQHRKQHRKQHRTIVHFSFSLFHADHQNCTSYCSGEHNSTKIIKKSGWKVKNGAKIMSDTSKYHQNGVGNIKMSSKSCRIHH